MPARIAMDIKLAKAIPVFAHLNDKNIPHTVMFNKPTNNANKSLFCCPPAIKKRENKNDKPQGIIDQNSIFITGIASINFLPRNNRIIKGEKINTITVI